MEPSALRLNGRSVLTRLLIICGIATHLACAGQSTSRHETAPTQPWSIEYSATGGVAGISQHLVLHDSGEAVVEGRRGLQTTFHIPSEQLARIQALVQRIDLSAPPPAKPKVGIPDMLDQSLIITSGGKEVLIGQQGRDLIAALQPILDQGRQRAEDEMWAKAGPFRLGRVWKVQEEVRDNRGLWHGEEWDGTWTRRADANAFDAFWRNNRSNQEVRDTVIVDLAERGKVKLHRGSGNVKYDGGYAAEHPESLTGYISPSQGSSWRASIEY